MSSAESQPENLRDMSLEAMQENLLAAGWMHPETGHPKQCFGGFYREYPRVNTLLQVGRWKRHVFDLGDVIERQAPWLNTGLGIGSFGDETEAGVSIMGEFTNIQDTTQVMIADSYLREVGFEVVEDDRLQDWLVMKGEPGQPRPGTAAFYEQSERAVAIRALTIPFIHDYKGIVLGDGLHDDAVQRLMDTNQALAALGVEPHMHDNARPVAFMDPTVRAERVAAVVRTALLSGKGLSGGARARLQSHDLAGGESPVIALDLHGDQEAIHQARLLQRLDGMLGQLGADGSEPA